MEQLTAASQRVDESFHRHVVESMRSGVITIDRQGNITTINPVACRILGLDRNAAIGRHCMETLADYMDIAQLLLDAYQKDFLPCRAEIDIKKKDRRGQTLGFTLSLVRNDADEVIGSAMFFKDLTRVEEIEEQERLKDRLVVLGQMAAGMAHEIRNPLAGIAITVDLVKRKTRAAMPELDEYLTSLVDETRRINKTVTDCLEFVRPLELELHAVDVNALLDDVLVGSVQGCNTSVIQIYREYNLALPPVLLDNHKIRQVFMNLLSNAFQAMDQGGLLTVRTGLEPVFGGRVLTMMGKNTPKRLTPFGDFDHYLVVTFSDTGKGMSPEILDRIFHPFFTTKITGSGIGLAIAQKIVDSHSGIIDVESTEGTGTTFRVKLPLVGEEKA